MGMATDQEPSPVTARLVAALPLMLYVAAPGWASTSVPFTVTVVGPVQAPAASTPPAAVRASVMERTGGVLSTVTVRLIVVAFDAWSTALTRTVTGPSGSRSV